MGFLIFKKEAAMNFTLSIGHFTDNTEKVLKGTGFGGVLEIGPHTQLFKGYSEDGSYMDVSLQGVVDVLSFIYERLSTHVSLHGKSEPITITLKVKESNVWKVVDKLGRVFHDLHNFKEDDVRFLLDTKLLKKNRSKSETHDLQKKIVTLLLSIHSLSTLNLYVPKVNRCDTSFQVAYTVVVEKNKQCESNIIPLRKSV